VNHLSLIVRNAHTASCRVTACVVIMRCYHAVCPFIYAVFILFFIHEVRSFIYCNNFLLLSVYEKGVYTCIIKLTTALPTTHKHQASHCS
jgi:hypothetical protein